MTKTNDDIHVNKKYKDTVFRKLFGENKENALSLYNAVNHTSYTDPDDLEYTTLEDVIYMKYKNDVSFLIDKTLSLYEHQSSYNPNMPLRGFLYYADLYRKLIHRSERLYSKHLLKIPLPHYIVFYNGSEKYMGEERRTLRLSDAFETDTGGGELCFGTVDSWLAWRLSGGRLHITDVSNASRTMLFDIHTLDWDDELLDLFDIPRSMLPEVVPTSAVYGTTDCPQVPVPIPIASLAGDQQAALFGQQCIAPFSAKTTYGTGCFIMLNTGDRPHASANNLLATVAWQLGGKTTYALEGSVFVGGSVIQWLRDGLKLFSSSADSEPLAASVEDTGGVYLVPALTGLGAPYWDPYARGTIVGITRGTTSAHITRAALEAIAFEVDDVVRAMAADTGHTSTEMRVDGGAVANSLLMQFQADLTGVRIIRPSVMESTALGAAMFAGLAVGFWHSTDEICALLKPDRTFSPEAAPALMEQRRKRWHEAVRRSRHWIEE